MALYLFVFNGQLEHAFRKLEDVIDYKLEKLLPIYNLICEHFPKLTDEQYGLRLDAYCARHVRIEKFAFPCDKDTKSLHYLLATHHNDVIVTGLFATEDQARKNVKRLPQGSCFTKTIGVVPLV